MGGTAALTAAVTLGLLRQWMWEAESWTEVLTVFTVTGALLFLLLLLPAPRRIIASLLSAPPPANGGGGKRGAPGARDKRAQQHIQSGQVQAQALQFGKHHHHYHHQQQQHHHQQQQEDEDEEEEEKKVPCGREYDGRRVRLKNTGRVFGMINTADMMVWPSQEMKARAGLNDWGDWRPYEGVEGTICHYWYPMNSEKAKDEPLRSSFIHVDLVVIRVDEGPSRPERIFVSALDGLEPADGCKEPIKLPRDGDVGTTKKSGVL